MEASPTHTVQRPIDWTSLHGALLLLLAGVSVYNFVRRDPTAFEWPAVDMGCFFERHQDPAFLPNDYFTNSVAQPNPRHVFGYFVLGVARVLGTDWYGAYFALRCLHTVAIPLLWYLALWGMLQPRLTSPRAETIARLALGVAIVLVMRRDVSGWFSFGWWPPFFIYVAAHPLALAVALLAIVLRTQKRFLTPFMWFCAAILHPAIGLFLVTFYWLWAFDGGRWRELLADLLCGVVLPFGLLLIWFRSPAPLSAAEFIEHYVCVAHPFHYQLSEFASLTGYPWWVSFALVLGLLAMGAGIAALRGNRRLALSSVLFLLAYAGCVLVQYVGTEVWLSKTIAVLGPSRFSCLGFYMVALVAVNLLAEYWPAGYADRILRSLDRWGTARAALRRPVSVAAAGAIAIAVMHGLLRDDLQHEIRGHYAGLYDWVERSTAADAVFLPPFDSPLHRELPIIAHRAVYASQAFPFREDAIREHMRRLSLAYGTLEQANECAGNDLLLRRRAYFRKLKPQNIVKLAERYRLDFVVVETDCRGPYQGYSPCYSDASVAVYAVDALRGTPDLEQSAPAVVAEPGASVLRK